MAYLYVCQVQTLEKQALDGTWKDSYDVGGSDVHFVVVLLSLCRSRHLRFIFYLRDLIILIKN